MEIVHEKETIKKFIVLSVIHSNHTIPPHAKGVHVVLNK